MRIFSCKSDTRIYDWIKGCCIFCYLVCYMPKATHEVEGEIRASNASDGNYQ